MRWITEEPGWNDSDPPPDSLSQCYDIIPDATATAIEQAAFHASRGNEHAAEMWRTEGGYGGL